jgi:hypothetical protein
MLEVKQVSVDTYITNGILEWKINIDYRVSVSLCTHRRLLLDGPILLLIIIQNNNCICFFFVRL